MRLRKSKQVSFEEGSDRFQSDGSLDELSLKKIRDAIPPRLFERSALKSTLYLVHDLLLASLVFCIARYWLKIVPDLLFWPSCLVYWILQGAIGFGIWVIGHECGHQAYSSNESLNDFVGLLIHSSLLTPYYSWKISHSMHHRSNGHMNKDMVYIPMTKKEYEAETRSIRAIFRRITKILTGYGINDSDKENNCINNAEEFLDETPLLAFLINVPHLIGILLIGWPLYLLINATGQNYGRWTSHFLPNSPIFSRKYDREVIISDIGVIVMVSILCYLTHITSLRTVGIHYFGPYVFINAWLVLVTFLHHTDPKVPKYRDGAWTYVKGALSTIDRDYGWFINHIQHHIADTHIVHHLFPRIPHYNAVEATKVIKPLLGDRYNYDNSFFLKSLWYSFCCCQYVPDEGEVLYYNK